jgi:hypothetical protein
VTVIQSTLAVETLFFWRLSLRVRHYNPALHGVRHANLLKLSRNAATERLQDRARHLLNEADERVRECLCLA